jgi:hypothetical protein
MWGAALLEPATFEEIRRDAGATSQAAAVVAVAGISEGLAGGSLGWGRALESALTLPVGWMIWAGITLLLGARLFKGGATWGEIVRVLGFAHAPWTLAVLGLLPGIGWLVSGSLVLWTLVAGWVALRCVLELDPARTMTTVAAGWAAVSALAVLF